MGTLLGSTSLCSPKLRQNSLVSVASGSITTRNLSFARLVFILALFGAAANGLKPWQMKPFILPWFMSSNVCSMSYDLSSLGK